MRENQSAGTARSMATGKQGTGTTEVDCWTSTAPRLKLSAEAASTTEHNCKDRQLLNELRNEFMCFAAALKIIFDPYTTCICKVLQLY